MAKPKIRHLAIFARSPRKLAEFYQVAFEMEVIHHAPDHTAYFLSDGYLTLAILPHRLEGEAAVGINHFGFQVEDMAAINRKLAQFEMESPKQRPAERPYAEYRACDPEGNQFDLSERGFENAESGRARSSREELV